MSDLLLHEHNLLDTHYFGWGRTEALNNGAWAVATSADGQDDPSLSVIIQTRNSASKLEGLFSDLDAQDYNGVRETIVIDAESSDDTTAIAKSFGATVISIAEADFSFPKARNKGFEAATHPYVVTLVGNSALSNTQTLRVATRYQNTENWAAAYGTVLPDNNASRWESIGAGLLGAYRRLASAAPANKAGMGFMCAAASVVVRDAWAEAGGYPEAYGAGGDDGELGKTFLKMGQVVMLDPAMAVYHTNGLDAVATLRQLNAWRQMAKPRDFDINKINQYNPAWY